ncbi:3087_t:CDS:2, partial [Dentiscutata heterogama]
YKLSLLNGDYIFVEELHIYQIGNGSRYKYSILNNTHDLDEWKKRGYEDDFEYWFEKDDGRFDWYYITLFYNDKPCSLDGFKLHYGTDEYDGYEYSITKNSNRTESFLIKSDARLYFKNNLLYKFYWNRYQLNDFRSKDGKICIYLILNNRIFNLTNDFKCKFIKREVYQTIDIDKSDIAFFDDKIFEEIKSEND